MKKKKHGFTLAEVLITLTIIGVIAAITIPAVISNQKDTEISAQFKKMYSTMTQAVNKTVMLDFGGNNGCHYGTGGNTSECIDFFKKFSENLNLTKECIGRAKEKGCVPDYTVSPADGCSGFSKSMIENNNTVYAASDGQIIIVYGGGAHGRAMPLFAVDINGFKAPNKAGHDLFAFQLDYSNDKGIFLTAVNGTCFPAAAGGRTAQEMMLHAFAGQE